MASHEELVEQVKDIQRSGADGKQAWSYYCAEYLEDVRDPNRHDESALEEFVDSYNRGDLVGRAGEQSVKAKLVDQVKTIQRSGPDGKEAWSDYCNEYLGGFMDPNRHDEGVLQEFIESYGGAIPAAGQRSAPQRSHAKRLPQAGGVGARAVLGPSQSIKGLAKLSKDFRKAWVSYCKRHGDGINNPAEHEESFLLGFADYVAGLVSADMEQQPAAGKKRAAAGDVSGDATAAAPAKKKVTIKKAVADKIQQLNSSGALLAAVRLPAVAPALSQIDEASALKALVLLEEQAGEVEDPNEFLKNHVKFLLEAAGEEQQEGEEEDFP